MARTRTLFALFGLAALVAMALLPSASAFDDLFIDGCAGNGLSPAPNPGPVVAGSTNACEAWYQTFEEYTPSTDGGNSALDGLHNPAAYDNQNGPGNAASQAIPTDPNIPSDFVGLTDIEYKAASTDAPSWAYQHLTASTSDTSDPIYAVLNAQDYSSVTEYGADDVEPTNYMGAQQTGQTLSTPGNEIIAWYGYWQPQQGDGVFHEQGDCTPSWTFCAGTNFVWRGSNTGEGTTGENLVGYLWNIPGGEAAGGGNNVPVVGGLPAADVVDVENNLCPDATQNAFSCGSGASYVGTVAVGEGMAGNCNKWQSYDANCISPEPSVPFLDQSNGTGTTGSQDSWNTGGGWFSTSPEDSLIIGKYTISVFGPASSQDPTSPYIMKVKSDGSTQGFFRDMNYYQAIAPGLGATYLSTMHVPRDEIANLGAGQTPVPIPAPVIDAVNNASDVAHYTCPTNSVTNPVNGQNGPCARDDRQSVAQDNAAHVTPSGASGMPYISVDLTGYVPSYAYPYDQSFENYYCGTTLGGAAGNNCIPSPPVGVFGYLANVGYPVEGLSTSFEPSALFLTGQETGFVWTDVNGDGFIGEPDSFTVQEYRAGVFNTANVGPTDCKGTNDCVTGYADQLGDVTVTPVGGWPAGSFFVEHSTDPTNAQPFQFGNTNTYSYLTPLNGNTPAVLTVSSTFCGADAGTCPTQDGILVPTGTATGLTSSINGHITWTEGTQTYDFNQGTVSTTQSV
ncbi:MAG: hypothetical protein ACYDDF_14365 [Thermoplasmatota archaeon]